VRPRVEILYVRFVPRLERVRSWKERRGGMERPRGKREWRVGIQ